MICSIHQPNFFPRLSTIAKLFASDIWVVLDDVQFARRDYQHRCRLARVEAPTEYKWLSLPVCRPQGLATRINKVRLLEPDKCRRRVSRLVRQYYDDSEHWPNFQPVFQDVIDQFGTTDNVASIAELSTRTLLRQLGWNGVIVRSSDFDVCSGRNERLADITQAVGATTYLCGTGGARYLDSKVFAARSLEVRFFGMPEDAAEVWGLARQASALLPLMTYGAVRLQCELEEAKASFIC